MTGSYRTRPRARTYEGNNRLEELPGLLASLYGIVDRLEQMFPDRRFTPDGHLVGSIGEVVAAHMFDLELLPASAAKHDATTVHGRQVQIKLTQGNGRVGLRAKPDHLLVLRLAKDRSIEIVYNGKGEVPWSRAGPMQTNGQRQISLKRLRDLSGSVTGSERLAVINDVDLMNHDRR